MVPGEEQAILDFLRQKALAGRFESTMTEIANGTKLSYNQVGRVLERLIIKGQVGFRERGTIRRLVRYLYLRDVLDLCRDKWR